MNAIFELPKSTVSVDHLVVATAGHKGKGTYSGAAIAKGDVIQRCAGLLLSSNDAACLLQTDIFPYLLANPADYGLENRTPSYAVMLGSMTYSNHSDQNNAVVQWAMTDLGLWFTLRAVRDVAEGDEVTMKYTNIDEYPNRADFKE